LRRHGLLQKAIEQELDAEIIHRAAEKDRRLPPVLHRGEVERMAGAIEHLELFLHFAIGVIVEFRPHDGIVQGGDTHRCLEFAARDAFEKMDLFGAPVEDAAERRAISERPDKGRRLEAEDVFQLVEQRDRIARRPVALVHEREDRHAPPAANFKKLSRLGFHAFGRIDHHQGRIHGS